MRRTFPPASGRSPLVVGEEVSYCCVHLSCTQRMQRAGHVGGRMRVPFISAGIFYFRCLLGLWGGGHWVHAGIVEVAVQMGPGY